MDLDNSLSVHTQALRARSLRSKLIASNIANGDTPHYKARDTGFGEALQQAGWTRPNARMSSTHEKHIGLSTAQFPQRILYRVPQHASLDGNTVDKDAEQARFAENTVRYQASLQFLNSKISSLVRTLRGD